MSVFSTSNLGLIQSRRQSVTLLGATGALIATGPAIAAPSKTTLRVAKNDTGITTIAEALAKAATLPGPVVIAIAPGVYREKLTVTVPDVTLAAAAPGVTIVYGVAALQTLMLS